MVLREQIKEQLDVYDKNEGMKPLVEVLADSTSEYKLPEKLSVEQSAAITRYAILYTAQRITPFRSPTEVEALVLKYNADAQLRNVFDNNIEHIIAGVKEAMRISREFISSAQEHEKQIELARKKPSQ